MNNVAALDLEISRIPQKESKNTPGLMEDFEHEIIKDVDLLESLDLDIRLLPKIPKDRVNKGDVEDTHADINNNNNNIKIIDNTPYLKWS